LATVEQAVIPAGGFAPYRAVFDADWDSFFDGSVTARLYDAAQGTAEGWVTLTIEDAEAQPLEDGRIVVMATVYNAGAAPAQVLRAVLTLEDEEQQVVGYRVVAFEPPITLDEGARLPLRIVVDPQEDGATAEYSLYVEARRVGDGLS
jgi:hypothetical protein